MRSPRAGLLIALLAACSAAPERSAAARAGPDPGMGDAADAFLADLERRTFDFFWETANPEHGLVPDRWPTESFSSVAHLWIDFRGIPDVYMRERGIDYFENSRRATLVRDDGTIAPTAAGGSIPRGPEVTIPALMAMRDRYGEHLHQRYGFKDAFNATFEARFRDGARWSRGWAGSTRTTWGSTRDRSC